jgi:hypothetical protein
MATRRLNAAASVFRDRDEMLRLTDIWAAAGKDASKQLSERAHQTSTAQDDVFQSVRGGSGPGTWAQWQVTIAYTKFPVILSPPPNHRGQYSYGQNDGRHEELARQRILPAAPVIVRPPGTLMRLHLLALP